MCDSWLDSLRVPARASPCFSMLFIGIDRCKHLNQSTHLLVLDVGNAAFYENGENAVSRAVESPKSGNRITVVYKGCCSS
jgi:hypothetical protein